MAETMSLPDTYQLRENCDDAANINIVEEALHHYGKRFGNQCEDQLLGFNRKAFPWTSANAPQLKELSGKEVRSELEKDLGLEQGALSEDPQLDFARTASTMATSVTGLEEDSDGEELRLCRMCNLPLGDIMYRQNTWCSGVKDTMHGECMALSMAHKEREKENARQQKEKLAKQQQHEEYGIGWKVDFIPRNEALASKLAMRDVPQGMVCLVLDEDSRSIRVASTVEPAASLNLEYLSIALEVRRRAGHEPVFSLDPADPNDKNTMQDKVFIPDWLAGTSVGEVLFQSDYHLKELSMGEHEQPVVGMKSCFHYSEMEEDAGEWSAREWFMVRKAEIHITDNSVLMPYVKMGVEAREQTLCGSSLEDLPITRPDHPMVRYAEAFTQNFDLIAERKSVIYHLRELAKTSVVAKFLLDAQVSLDENWFRLADQRSIPCSLEVPQLWNKTQSSQITMHDDKINGKGRQHGVFGGVNFGLDKFNLSRGIARASPAASLSMSTAGRGFAGRRVGLMAAKPLMASAMDISKPPQAATLEGLSMSTAQQISPARLAGPGAALSAGKQPLLRSNFAESLIARAAATPGGTFDIKAPGQISLAPPAAALSLATQPKGPLVPGLGAPRLGVGRLPGAPGTLGVASFVGKAPTGAPFLPGAQIPLRLTQPDLTPLSLQPSAQLPAPAGPLSAAALTGRPIAGVPPISAAVMAPRVSALASIPRLQASLQASAVAPQLDVEGADKLQGVDLRLDSFDLSEAKRVSLEAQEGSWGSEARSLDECVAVGQAFWSGLKDDADLFKEDDRALLQRIFNEELSDRRMEGDLFTPPDATYDYVQKLRVLVKEEDMVRQSRMEHFCSKAFTMTNPGTLFPASWSSGFEAHRSGAAVRESAERPQASLHERPEYKGQAAELLLQVMRASAPVFDKMTEEGLHFRIYQMGTLEVRTTQMPGSEEEVGVVFSIRTPTSKGGRKGECIDEQEKIVKATEYVEASMVGNCAVEKVAAQCRFYLVLETETGHKIVTERLNNGKATWEEDPEYAEDRNSLAKVTRIKQASAGLTVRDMKVYHKTITTKGSDHSSITQSVCKRYARNMFARAVATPGGQATAMPARSARLASEARMAGRPPAWADITMASN